MLRACWEPFLSCHPSLKNNMNRFLAFLCLLLAIRLLVFYLFPPKIETISKTPLRETTIFTQIKDHIKSSYSQNLNPKDSALLMGIVFGDKSLDYNSNKKFISTGVLHIVAASGMNVSMLTNFLLAFLLLFLRRQHALILTGLSILFYTALADFQPSIIRAAIMAYFALTAGALGRQNTGILTLFFAAFVMIFWDPAVLVSLSFILSFTATLGIILMDPILKQGVLRGSIFEDLRTTFSAQIATTPILLFFFGTYSPISILVNFLVLWTVPPLMILGGIAAILSFITPILAAPVVYLSLPLLTYFWAVVDYFARLSAPWQLKGIPWSLIIGYYLIVLAIVLVFNKKRI